MINNNGKEYFFKKMYTHIHTHTLILFLVAQTVKSLPAMRETWVRSLGWEDPLEEGMATHSSILAWRIPMERGVWQATVHGVTKSQTRLSYGNQPVLNLTLWLFFR